MKSATKMSSLHYEPSYDHIHTDCHHTTATTTHHRSMNQRNNVQTTTTATATTHSISTAKQPKCASHDKSVVKRGRTLDKSSDFLRWHKTKLKACDSSNGGGGGSGGGSSRNSRISHRHSHWHWMPSSHYILVITIVLFASLSEVLICVAQASDIIRASDVDDKSNNQKYTDLGITTDPLVATRDGGASNGGIGGSSSRNNPGQLFNLDRIGSNLELNLAAVFNKVAYGTTTKRSIADNVFVPTLTTVPTPQLTTFR